MHFSKSLLATALMLAGPQAAVVLAAPAAPPPPQPGSSGLTGGDCGMSMGGCPDDPIPPGGDCGMSMGGCVPGTPSWNAKREENKKAKRAFGSPDSETGPSACAGSASGCVPSGTNYKAKRENKKAKRAFGLPDSETGPSACKGTASGCVARREPGGGTVITTPQTPAADPGPPAPIGNPSPGSDNDGAAPMPVSD